MRTFRTGPPVPRPRPAPRPCAPPRPPWGRRLALLPGVLTLLLAGCGAAGDAREPTGGLGIVLGATATSPSVASSPAVADAVARAVMTQSDDVVVVADGRPHVLATGSLRLVTENADSQEAERTRLEEELLGIVGFAVADDPEADLLAAVDLAARELADTSGERTLVAVSSGLSTVPPMAFQEGLLGAEPSDVVAHLTTIGALPELTGFTVVLSGFGDTVAPQDALNRVQRGALVAIWEAVFRAAGADVVVDARPLAGTAADDLPTMTTVEVSLPPNPPCVTVLPDSVLAFRANTADLVDERAAREQLEPLVARLRESTAPISLVGTTARVGDLAGQRALAFDRARRVADLLIAAGIQEDRLTVTGLGSEFPEYVPDHDAAGRLLPGPAAQNRTVRVQVAELGCPAR